MELLTSAMPVAPGRSLTGIVAYNKTYSRGEKNTSAASDGARFLKGGKGVKVGLKRWGNSTSLPFSPIPLSPFPIPFLFLSPLFPFPQT